MTGSAMSGRGWQTLIGLSLAVAIVGGWVALHVTGVFFWRWSPLGIALAPAAILLQGWLGAGLFIVAHDAMHGSLAPRRPRLNRAVGRLCLGLYAAFPFDALNRAHHRHHAAPGSADDPDFHPARPTAYARWLHGFMRRYFGLREFACVTGVLVVYLAVLHVRPLNAGLFWGLPAILSALQLFTFGTWLPHRHRPGEPGFADRHNARTLGYPWLVSLLTCFHFGYHLEHHHSPQSPWWRLPAVRAAARVGAGSRPVKPVPAS